ncbi:MAG: hypothetical protein ACL93V_02375 [Candidatus Electrothrix sp. YB6]
MTQRRQIKIMKLIPAIAVAVLMGAADNADAVNINITINTPDIPGDINRLENGPIKPPALPIQQYAQDRYNNRAEKATVMATKLDVTNRPPEMVFAMDNLMSATVKQAIKGTLKPQFQQDIAKDIQTRILP